MPSGEELLRSLADETSTQETLAELHDAGMSDRQIGELYGVNRGTVWRTRKGQSSGPKLSRNDSFRNEKAARAFERIAARSIRVGKVRVNYAGTKSRPEGYRDIPALDIDDPDEIASAIRDGEYEQAAAALSAQIMAAYGAGDDEAVYLEIDDYENGI